jgi:prepilin peptidase CpaA
LAATDVEDRLVNSLLWLLVPIGLVAIATLHDLASREIPDWISLLLLAWGIAAAALSPTVGAAAGALIGGLIGFALTAPLFWMGGIGGGDVKLIAALGVCLGPGLLLAALFWTAVAGGVLALIAKLRGQQDFAYVPAILAGLVLAVLRLGVVEHAAS